MTKQELIDTAKTLQPPSTDAASESAAKNDQMAARINVLMEARPDLTRLIGEDNLEMMRDNHRNHARFISSLLGSGFSSNSALVAMIIPGVQNPH